MLLTAFHRHLRPGAVRAAGGERCRLGIPHPRGDGDDPATIQACDRGGNQRPGVCLDGQEPLLAISMTQDEVRRLQDDGRLRLLTADNLSQQRRLDVLEPQVRMRPSTLPRAIVASADANCDPYPVGDML